jgi:hypothetical protein
MQMLPLDHMGWQIIRSQLTDNTPESTLRLPIAMYPQMMHDMQGALTSSRYSRALAAPSDCTSMLHAQDPACEYTSTHHGRYMMSFDNLRHIAERTSPSRARTDTRQADT